MAGLAGLAGLAILIAAVISSGPSGTGAIATVLAEETAPADTLRPPATEGDIEVKERELQRLRSDLEDKRKQASDLAGREQDITGEIDRLNGEMSLNQELLRKLGQKKAVLLEDLAYAQSDLTRAEDSFGMASNLLGARLRGIYKFGRSEAMEVILTSKTFADLGNRIYYLSIVADHDLALMSDFEKTVETKRVLVDHIEGKRLRLEENEAEVAQETQNLKLKKEERDALVTQLKGKRYYYENMARDLQEASRNLEEVLSGLEDKRAGAGYTGTSFSGRMGRLVWPCEGEVISSFGVETHPKFGTIIKNNGIDIKASGGARVRAVGAGSVSFAGPLTGFGNCVIIDHGSGYYTFYGRLESIVVSTGYDVAEGDPVGFVGETSAPEGAVLHFEIRQGKKALDPELWLVR
jgi:septal ring factor EnvC (AmiA/AmiB activator)